MFPRLVFKNGGKLQRAGGMYSTELANDEAEHDALVAAGWSATLPEAIAPKIEPDVDGEPTREEIIQKLEQLNVVFDRRLGDKKLAALLDDALKQRGS